MMDNSDENRKCQTINDWKKFQHTLNNKCANVGTRIVRVRTVRVYIRKMASDILFVFEQYMEFIRLLCSACNIRICTGRVTKFPKLIEICYCR